MVKQGKFSRVSSQKQLKNRIKQKKQGNRRTIADEKLEEFVLVRYGLTLKKNLNKLSQETMQRFLMIWIETGQTIESPKWSIQQLMKTTLQRVNIRVPWQFFKEMAENWGVVQHFIVKELPAVPLAQRLLVTDELDKVGIQKLISEQLAVNFFIDTFQEDAKRLAGVTTEQIQQLQSSFLIDDQIDWQKVQTIFDPLGYVRNTNDDVSTQEWLKQLAQS